MTNVSYKMKLIAINFFTGIISLYFLIDGAINSNFGQSFWLAGVTLAVISFLFYVLVLRPMDTFCENYFDNTLETLEKLIKNFSKISKNSKEYLSNNTKELDLLLEQDSVLAELNFSIDKTLKNAEESLSYMNKSKNMSEEGKRVLDGLKEAMDGIRGAASALEEIISVIGDINQKTKIINEIVFETKLLSFNASIEAARAGQYGKGFAVVAQEIGNLALMSGKASLGISSLLENSTNQVKELGTYIQEKIKDGERSADECKRVFVEISDGLPSTLSSLDTVFGLMRKQQMEMERIVGNIAKLDQMIKRDGTVTKEMTLAVAELTKDADELNEHVVSMNDFFTVGNIVERRNSGQQYQDQYQYQNQNQNQFENNFDNGMNGTNGSTNNNYNSDLIIKDGGSNFNQDNLFANGGKNDSSEVNGLSNVEQEMNNIEDQLNPMKEVVNGDNVSAVDRAREIAELYNKSLKKNVDTSDTPTANDSRFKDNE
ncbi:MAG: hypothetical protein HQK49_18995 [Oligoflexia bacterium]|nr:hypothetical protein [Oligoflexia bacterium]